MKIDRRGFLKFLGIGAAVPAVAALKPAAAEAVEDVGGFDLSYQSDVPDGYFDASSDVLQVPAGQPWRTVAGNHYTPQSTGLMVDKSGGQEWIPFCNHESIHDVRYTAAASPVQFIQIHRCKDAHGGFEISFQHDLPVGYWDDGLTPLGGKLRSAKAHEWVIYWVDYHNQLSALTVGQAAYESFWAAERALYTEKPVLCPSIEASPFRKRTAIIVQANATDLYGARFIELEATCE